MFGQLGSHSERLRRSPVVKNVSSSRALVVAWPCRLLKSRVKRCVRRGARAAQENFARGGAVELICFLRTWNFWRLLQRPSRRGGPRRALPVACSVRAQGFPVIWRAGLGPRASCFARAGWDRHCSHDVHSPPIPAVEAIAVLFLMS